MAHEQSETIQRPDGRWINVYGAKTPRAGQQLPDTPDFATSEEAVGAAKLRSESYTPPPIEADERRDAMPTQVPPGSAMAVKQYAGGGGVRRRVKARGPRLLKYADGGLVRRASGVIEAGARMVGAKGAKNIDRAEKEARENREYQYGQHMELKKELVVKKKFEPVGAGGHGARARRLEELEHEALK